MILRAAQPRDAEAVSEILNESIRAGDSTMLLTPLAEDDVARQITTLGDRERLLVLEQDEDIQGWGILKRYGDREGYRFACETSVFLRRRHVGARTGLGTTLQTELMRISQELGYHHIVTKIWATNVISIRMHSKLGFEVVGTQREIGFAHETWQDVVIMQFIHEPH